MNIMNHTYSTGVARDRRSYAKSRPSRCRAEGNVQGPTFLSARRR